MIASMEAAAISEQQQQCVRDFKRLSMAVINPWMDIALVIAGSTKRWDLGPFPGPVGPRQDCSEHARASVAHFFLQLGFHNVFLNSANGPSHVVADQAVARLWLRPTKPVTDKEVVSTFNSTPKPWFLFAVKFTDGATSVADSLSHTRPLFLFTVGQEGAFKPANALAAHLFEQLDADD